LISTFPAPPSILSLLRRPALLSMWAVLNSYGPHPTCSSLGPVGIHTHTTPRSTWIGG
jgi:hypothetical protein